MSVIKLALTAVATLAILGIHALFTYPVASYSRLFHGYNLTYLLSVYTILLNLLAFIPALVFNTEKFFDLTGGITFISTTILATVTNPSPQITQLIAASMVIIWSGRLATFLFMRIMRVGEDIRFRTIKKSPLRFMNVWLLQALWVMIPLSPLLVVMTDQSAQEKATLTPTSYAGIAIWAVGVAVQVIADQQKTKFNTKPSNKGKFINVGLWSISRHPNYVGEIVLWLGATIYALPFMTDMQHVALLCPVFIYILLKYISGVPMLETKSDKKWGEETAYIDYKRNTPVLFPIGSGDQVEGFKN